MSARGSRTRVQAWPERVRPRGPLRALAVALAMLCLAGAAAHAQTVTLHVQGQGRELHAGLPFVLAVSAEGFEPEPEPEIEPFEIPGCDVSFLGVSPNISTSISIINGRRSETRRVEFVYRYRVEAREAGTYRVPAITVTQGERKATSRPASFRAIDVPSTRDMRIALELPERPMWVGETFDLTIDWLLRRDPGEPSFSIPLLDDPAWIDVHPPPVENRRRRRALRITAGDRDIELPYTQDTVTQGGVEYTRVRMTLPVTPVKAGTLEIEPAQVVAELQVGMGRDAFGFPVPRSELFRAADRPRSLEIRPLPLADRPPSFAGAVGTAFSIKVQASRTVVRVGEPIELDILIRGNGRMEGLSLPELDTDHGLPPELFAVADSPATGELVEEGESKGKRFRVTARLQSAEAREIPRIGFSYFDPADGAYQTVYSEPIALQVAGSSVVGADDVVSAVVRRTDTGAKPGADGAGSAAAQVGAFVGVDFALSSPERALATAWTTADIRVLLYALYLLPVLILIGRIWQVRTRERRGQSSEVKQALREVEQALARAATEPAREAAPQVLAALRALARVTGQRASGDVIARLETESYSPAAAEAPMDPSLRAEVEGLAASWARSRDARPTGTAATALALLVGGALLAAPRPSLATPAAGATTAAAPDPGESGEAGAPAGADVIGVDPASLDAARRAYEEALARTDRDARARGFARAESLFRALVQAHPGSPALLTDWGNAALGAQDLGRATLAYRRALALDPGYERAARNLAWVRERAPDWLPQPVQERAADSLFFWHYALSVPARHVIAAVAFAAAVLLLAPWGWRPRLRRLLALAPAAIWLAMVLSILSAPEPGSDAVVLVDGATLRAADSAGAPAALPSPLPAGAEITVHETRGTWIRVALANGTEGWLPSSAIERVQPAAR